MEQDYGVVALMGDMVISLRSVNDDEAKHLNLTVPHSVMELKLVTLDLQGVLFSFGRQIWRGELAEFSAEVRQA